MHVVSITYHLKTSKTEIMIGKTKFVEPKRKKMTAPDYFPIYRVV